MFFRCTAPRWSKREKFFRKVLWRSCFSMTDRAFHTNWLFLSIKWDRFLGTTCEHSWQSWRWPYCYFSGPITIFSVKLFTVWKDLKTVSCYRPVQIWNDFWTQYRCRNDFCEPKKTFFKWNQAWWKGSLFSRTLSGHRSRHLNQLHRLDTLNEILCYQGKYPSNADRNFI